MNFLMYIYWMATLNQKFKKWTFLSTNNTQNNIPSKHLAPKKEIQSPILAIGDIEKVQRGLEWAFAYSPVDYRATNDHYYESSSRKLWFVKPFDRELTSNIINLSRCYCFVHSFYQEIRSGIFHIKDIYSQLINQHTKRKFYFPRLEL